MADSTTEASQRIPELEQRLTRACAGLGLGTPCYAFQAVASTMDVARELAEQGAAEGTCVWAETQTGGRGRAGRVWVSPPGGLYCSLILRPTRELREIPQLALVGGLAVVETIREVAGLWASIRWPNDVLYNGQKLAGVLVEASTSGGQGSRHKVQGHAPSTLNLVPCTSIYAVVGIGINVTTSREDLPKEATALAFWKNPGLDRAALAGMLFRCLEQTYRQWQAEGFGAIRAQVARWNGLFGQLVHITTAQESFQGQAVDLDESGRLLVRLDSGVVRPVEVGEVTLLK